MENGSSVEIVEEENRIVIKPNGKKRVGLANGIRKDIRHIYQRDLRRWHGKSWKNPHLVDNHARGRRRKRSQRKMYAANRLTPSIVFTALKLVIFVAGPVIMKAAAAPRLKPPPSHSMIRGIVPSSADVDRHSQGCGHEHTKPRWLRPDRLCRPSRDRDFRRKKSSLRKPAAKISFETQALTISCTSGRIFDALGAYRK